MCKEADYDIAVLYLENADYDLAMAVQTYQADEAWEREHPLEAGQSKGKGTVNKRSWKRASQAAFLRRAGPSNKR